MYDGIGITGWKSIHTSKHSCFQNLYFQLKMRLQGTIWHSTTPCCLSLLQDQSSKHAWGLSFITLFNTVWEKNCITLVHTSVMVMSDTQITLHNSELSEAVIVSYSSWWRLWMNVFYITAMPQCLTVISFSSPVCALMMDWLLDRGMALSGQAKS